MFCTVRAEVTVDVSRYAGRYEHVFETTTAGVTIQSPQLDINTVAAGGGSRLFWKNGLFVVGPESAGAHPGPACYRYLSISLLLSLLCYIHEYSISLDALNKFFYCHTHISCFHIVPTQMTYRQKRWTPYCNRRKSLPWPPSPSLLPQNLR